MDRDDAKEMAALKAEEKKQKEAEEEQMTYLIAGLVIVALLAAIAFGLSEINDMCAKARCGR
jgi:hypothetical protein